MQKTKRILALIGVILLVLLYISTIIASFTASKNGPGLFMISIYATIAIPVLIWVINMFLNLAKKKRDEENSTPDSTSKDSDDTKK